MFFTGNRTISTCLLAIANSSSTTIVRSVDGFVEMDQVGVAALISAIDSYIQACYTWVKTIIDLVDAAESVDDIRAIDYYSGIPVISTSDVSMDVR